MSPKNRFDCQIAAGATHVFAWKFVSECLFVVVC